MIAWRRPFAAVLELTLRCPCRCLTCGSGAGAPRAGELAHDLDEQPEILLDEVGDPKLAALAAKT